MRFYFILLLHYQGRSYGMFWVLKEFKLEYTFASISKFCSTEIEICCSQQTHSMGSKYTKNTVSAKALSAPDQAGELTVLFRPLSLISVGALCGEMKGVK